MKPPPTRLSDGWKALNEELHQTELEYGVTFPNICAKVARIIGEWRIKTVLDYGCGKGELQRRFDGKLCQVRGYDPCVLPYSGTPQPAELLVSIAALEHVEPEHVDAVLDHMAELTEKMAFITVACVPSMHTLSDGRNAHATIRPRDWWVKKLLSRWDYWVIRRERRGVTFTGFKKEK